MEEAIREYHFPAPVPELEQSEKLADFGSVTGAVLLSYVWWILKQAQERGIRKLYFLARDGFLLREIALRMCKAFSLDLECRYLYCSRMALRMPCYWFLEDEAFDLLLQSGYYKTISGILTRGGLSRVEQEALLNEFGIPCARLDCGLSEPEFRSFTRLLRKSQTYRNLVMERSKAAYSGAVGYLAQEGLLSAPHVALVDSGWIGSIQRSIRQLLQHAGWSGQLTGFYFGMFQTSKDPADGTYLSWYFRENDGMHRKIFFCNNLLECILSAPHGMTLGYEMENGSWVPRLAWQDPAVLPVIQEQLRSIIYFTEQALPNLSFQAFKPELLSRMTYRLLKQLMYSPSPQNVRAYQEFLFSDDITGCCPTGLVEPGQLDRLNQYLLFPRLWKKCFPGSGKRAVPEPFWLYGSVAMLPRWKRGWYRFNIFVWEWLRYTLRSP